MNFKGYYQRRATRTQHEKMCLFSNTFRAWRHNTFELVPIGYGLREWQKGVRGESVIPQITCERHLRKQQARYAGLSGVSGLGVRSATLSFWIAAAAILCRITAAALSPGPLLSLFPASGRLSFCI